jgi:hypothetical protein
MRVIFVKWIHVVVPFRPGDTPRHAIMSLPLDHPHIKHSWTGTTVRYVHVHATHVEDAWVAGQQRAADRWKGLAP